VGSEVFVEEDLELRLLQSLGAAVDLLAMHLDVAARDATRRTGGREVSLQAEIRRELFELRLAHFLQEAGRGHCFCADGMNRGERATVMQVFAMWLFNGRGRGL
jgi:hypothetical protein